MFDRDGFEEMLEDISWLLEDCSYESAELLLDAMIPKVEESDVYKEDVANGRLCISNQEEADLYLAGMKDINEVEGAQMPYHEMYLMKAEAMGDNPEIIDYIERAHEWAPANYDITRRLIRACFDYWLYDKGTEHSLKAFRFVEDKDKEAALFYWIRRMGEGCCWELDEKELEGEDSFAKNIDNSSFKEDFDAFGIPITAAEIRILTDEQIEEIVRKCFPEECEPECLSPETEVLTNDEKCPFCGDRKYFVNRTYVCVHERVGKELYIEDGGPLVATCLRCRCTLEVPWVEAKNKAEEKERNERNHRLFMEHFGNFDK